MADHDHGATRAQPIDGRRDRGLRVGVEVGRRLVEDDEVGVPQEGAGDRDPLPLAAAQADAVLAERGAVADGEVRDERVRVGRTRGSDDLAHRSRRAGPAGCCRRPCRGTGAAPAARRRSARARRHRQARGPSRRRPRRRQDPALVGLEEAEQQPRQRRLAGARRADDRGPPASREDHEVDVVEGGLGPARVRDGDAAEDRMSPSARGAGAAWTGSIDGAPAGRRARGDRRVEDLEDARRRLAARRALVVVRGQPAQRQEELRGDDQDRERRPRSRSRPSSAGG